MDAATALSDLQMMADYESDPALTVGELARILETSRRVDIGGNNVGNSVDAPTWEPSTVYYVGNIVTPDPADGSYFMCSTPARSGSVQPVWPSVSGIQPFADAISDADVRWNYCGMTWVPTWNLNAAAAKAWQVKAGKVASRYNFTSDGQMFERAQMLGHCRTMEKSYRRKIANV